jgi:hypothetical protein
MMLNAPNRHRPVLLSTGRWSSRDRQYALITCGLFALVGTGIVAVIDHGAGGTAQASNTLGKSKPPLTSSGADQRPATSAPQGAPVRAPLPPAASAPATASASEPAPGNAPPAPPLSQAAPAAYAIAAAADTAAIAPEEPTTTGTFTAPRSAAQPTGSQALPDDNARRLSRTQASPDDSARTDPKAATTPSDGVRATAKTQAPSSDCRLPLLKAVLADVEAQFGAVTIVATNPFKTVNHIAGSAREKLHHDCKAIDFRPERERIEDIKTYLRGRPEIAGIESYRDGVIHIDAAARVAAGPAHKPSPRAQAGL